MKEKCEGKELRVYRCNVCGNLIIQIEDSGVNPVCCGRDMELLAPGTFDGAEEKHVPIWRMDGCKVIVRVGSEDHPMIASHYVQWIILETDKGFHTKKLCPDDDPSACFKLCKDEHVIAVYEYCNIHKLWKSSVKGKEYECPLCGI